MARARNIKPGLFKNEVLGVADPLYTLLFEGLWLLADRAGRLEDRPLRIKAEVFPYRDGLDIGAMLGWLQANGFIRRYTAGGFALIQIDAFQKHQNPHKNEPESAFEAPTEPIGVDTEEIGSAPADSGFRIPDSGFTALQPSASAPPAAPARSRRKAKVPMPEDFGVSERVRRWATEKGYGRLEAHLEAFKRKAQANAYAYADWDSAFMEAIREDWAKLRGKTMTGAAPPPEATTSDAAEKTKAMLDAQRLTPDEQAKSDAARVQALAGWHKRKEAA